jgi:hypothetical protein
LRGFDLFVVGGGWVVVASYPLSSQAPTPVEVELGCDNYTNEKDIFNITPNGSFCNLDLSTTRHCA